MGGRAQGRGRGRGVDHSALSPACRAGGQNPTLPADFPAPSQQTVFPGDGDIDRQGDVVRRDVDLGRHRTRIPGQGRPGDDADGHLPAADRRPGRGRPFSGAVAMTVRLPGSTTAGCGGSSTPLKWFLKDPLPGRPEGPHGGGRSRTGCRPGPFPARTGQGAPRFPRPGRRKSTGPR